MNTTTPTKNSASETRLAPRYVRFSCPACGAECGEAAPGALCECHKCGADVRVPETAAARQKSALPTPGQWRTATLDIHTGRPLGYVAVVDACDDELARMNPRTPTPIAVANAELMASAPALRAAALAVEAKCPLELGYGLISEALYPVTLSGAEIQALRLALMVFGFPQEAR